MNTESTSWLNTLFSATKSINKTEKKKRFTNFFMEIVLKIKRINV